MTSPVPSGDPVADEPRRTLDQAIAGVRVDDRAAAADLLWYCRRIAGRTFAPQDVTDGSQALAELAMTQVDPGRGAASCWMYLVVAARTAIRRALARGRTIAAPPDIPVQLELERALDEARLAARLPALVDLLPPKMRETIRRFYFDGESVATIASALDCAPGTIKARLHIARQQLRVLLTRTEGEER
ncbi:MAG TPA: sigma-70 family RNA polymerase sigma factor [Nannocystaceae bacterium]|nr:sigma-70 family RNA polymerase sigma factor [Nannocystaceae bacterium]